MKQQLHKTHGYGFDSSHAGWVNGDTILRGHTVEWGGGRASYRVRILGREKEGISKGELRGETRGGVLVAGLLGDFWRKSSEESNPFC